MRVGYLVKAVIESGDLGRDYLVDYSGVEVQLLVSSLGIDIQEQVDRVVDSGTLIHSLHLAIRPGIATGIEDVLDPKMLGEISYSMELANRIAEVQGSDEIIVVFHTDLPGGNPSYLGVVMAEVAKKFEELLSKYSRVKVGIENTCILKDDGSITWFVYGLDNFKGVYDSLVEYTGLADRFCIVFDFCHLEINMRLISRIDTSCVTGNLKNMEEVIKSISGVCELVHLADTKNTGYGVSEHGVGFERNKESLDRLDGYLGLIDKYLSRAKVVLEITEKDYVERPDANRTLDIIKDIKGI